MQSEKKVSQFNAEKVSKIAEILGILQETHRGKDWVLREIKKHHQKIQLKSVLNSYEILISCPSDFVTNLHRALQGDSVKGFEDAHALTKTYHWLFTDIVGVSNPTLQTKDQVRKILTLNELMARTETFRNRDPASTVILPVGDGVAIGFGDSPEKPLRLAIELHKALYRFNESQGDKEKLSIRIGIDMGPVYFVKDLNGKDNVWGPGIILTRRVMDLGVGMHILASARIAEDIRKLSPEYKKILRPIGNYSIKHGEELALYNIYGDGFGNKVAPRKAKVINPNLERDMRLVNNFSYNKMDIDLDILDPNTMLTRHTWVWNVINVSQKPMEEIFFSLDGDIPKEFGDMNVDVRDDNNNVLEILGVSVNNPYHKEFNVRLNRPIKTRQKKTLILKYDWEEPERTYFYKFATGCTHFKFSLTALDTMEMKVRILNVDTETGNKIDASSPEIKNVNGKTIVTWSKDDLTSNEAYQFNW